MTDDNMELMLASWQHRLDDQRQRTIADLLGNGTHSHSCAKCGRMRTCLVLDCQARRNRASEATWTCFVCRRDATTAQDAEMDRAMNGED